MKLPHMGRMSATVLPLGLALLFPATTLAQTNVDKALKEELRFISALIDSPYASLAQDVIEAAKKTFPTAAGQLEAPAMRAKLRTGRFEEVENIIKERKDQDSFDTWTLKMELAASYYAAKDYKKADDLYKAFFKKFTKVSDTDKPVYESAIYFYIDMLKRLGREDEIFPLYKAAMENASSNDSMKTFRASYVNALLAEAEKAYAAGDKAKGDAYCKDADKLASEMLWVQDIYFGDAINAKAHICILKGDITGAQSLLNDYLEMLTKIHDSLKEQDPTLLRISPLPKCRYLLGSMMYRMAVEEINKAGGKVTKGTPASDKVLNLLLGERNPKTKKRNEQGALYHCANVFMNYPESESADGAITICDDITKILDEQYKTKINISADAATRANVRRQKFIAADDLFSNNKFEEAYAKYKAIIDAEKDPYTADMMGPLMKFIKSTIWIDNDKLNAGKISKADCHKEAKELVKTFAENYAKPAKKDCAASAGQALGELADYCAQHNLVDLRIEVEGYFFTYYGNDSSAMARKLKRAQETIETSTVAKDVEKALAELQEIADGADANQRDTRESAILLLMNAYKRKDGVLKYDNEKHLAAAKQVIDHFKSVKRPGYYAAVAMYEYASALVEGANKLRNSAEKTEEDAAKIKKSYDEAIKTLEDLLVEIEKGKDVSKYIVTENDAKNIKLLQEPIAYLIPAWAQRNEDIEKAKAGFIKYIETYPKGTNTPKCLLQLGSIYAAQENAAESKKQLDRLKAEFGTSPEAKNALPLLADAFAQMNRKSDTVRAYREMLESNETYSAQIYRLAAQRLFDYEAYNDAIKAADALLKAKETEKVASYKRDGMAIRTRALMMTEKPENIAEARKQVDAYLALVGKTVYAVDVHRLIVELAAYEMKIVAKDAYDERDAIIKRAKDSEKYIANSNIEIDPETRLPKFDEKGRQIMKAIKFDETGKIVSNPPLIVAKTSSDIAALAKAAFESLDSADPQREKWLGSAMNAYAATMRSVDLDKVAAQLHLLQGEDAAANDQKKALKEAQTLTVEKRDAYKATNDEYKKVTSALKKAKKGTDEYKKLRAEYSTLKKQNESLKKEYETARKAYEKQKATVERAAEEAKTYLAKYLEISTIIQDAYLTNLKLMEIRRTMANAAGNDEDRRFYAEEIQATVDKYYEAFGENNSRKAFEKAIRMDDVKEVELGNSSFLKR